MKLMSLFRGWLAEGQDDWSPSKIRQVYDGYSWDLALKGARAARKRTPSGRLYARKPAQDAPQTNVRPFKVVR